MIKFYKYQATGNDFILIDNRNNKLNAVNKEFVKKLCDRRFGIGADGLMLLQNTDKADFEMVYFNSDGSGATMCGNGGRCIVAFAKKIELIGNNTKFVASDGMHLAKIDEAANVHLKMHDVSEVQINDKFVFLNTGSPHHVCFPSNIKNVDVYNEGRKIRYSEKYKDGGTNVNFVNIQNNNIEVKTYERGVENETLSCGTGVVASAISANLRTKQAYTKFNVNTKGGKLQVIFDKNETVFSNIWLIGAADFVFEGVLRNRY